MKRKHDPKDLIKKINNKTKAVIVLYMLGTNKINEIRKICKYNLTLIEDTAWDVVQYKKILNLSILI